MLLLSSFDHSAGSTLKLRHVGSSVLLSASIATALEMAPEPGQRKGSFITAHMTGAIRRLMYWPDDGASIVYEDGMDFDVQGIAGCGTRQSAFRIGEFDPSLGGCG